MAVTYSTAVKTDRMTTTRDYFANGTLELLDGATVLATFGLSASGGSVSTDTWTLAFDDDTVAAGATGTADGAQVKTSGGTVGISGLTVGTSGTDIVIVNTSIVVGQSVQAGTITFQHS